MPIFVDVRVRRVGHRGHDDRPEGGYGAGNQGGTGETAPRASLLKVYNQQHQEMEEEA